MRASSRVATKRKFDDFIVDEPKQVSKTSRKTTHSYNDNNDVVKENEDYSSHKMVLVTEIADLTNKSGMLNKEIEELVVKKEILVKEIEELAPQRLLFTKERAELDIALSSFEEEQVKLSAERAKMHETLSEHAFMLDELKELKREKEHIANALKLQQRLLFSRHGKKRISDFMSAT